MTRELGCEVAIVVGAGIGKAIAFSFGEVGVGELPAQTDG
jgi:hypothetical protein